MHERNRQVASKAKLRRRSAAGAALDRVRDGFRLRRCLSTVCVLSNHPVVLERLEQAIDKTMFRVLAERLKPFGSGFGETLQLPDDSLCVLDVLGPQPASAIIVQQILRASPRAQILLVAENDAERQCFELLLLGARGLLSYGETAEQLTHALTCIADGGFWLSPTRLSRFVDTFLGRYHHKPLVGTVLSRRENEIVQKLFRNYSNKEIANELNISERTVKFHVSNLLQKFGVRGRMELVLSYGPAAPVGLLGSYPREEQTEDENLSSPHHGQRRFLQGMKDEDENILPVTHRPAYSVS